MEQQRSSMASHMNASWLAVYTHNLWMTNDLSQSNVNSAASNKNIKCQTSWWCSTWMNALLATNSSPINRTIDTVRSKIVPCRVEGYAYFLICDYASSFIIFYHLPNQISCQYHMIGLCFTWSRLIRTVLCLPDNLTESIAPTSLTWKCMPRISAMCCACARWGSTLRLPIMTQQQDIVLTDVLLWRHICLHL